MRRHAGRLLWQLVGFLAVVGILGFLLDYTLGGR